MISSGIVTVSYIAATVLFILALGGLSDQETARRGNWYGISGMAIALFATVFGVVTNNYVELMAALVVGGSIGLLLALDPAATAVLLVGLIDGLMIQLFLDPKGLGDPGVLRRAFLTAVRSLLGRTGPDV